MTSARARLARARPRIPLKDHPLKLVLACIDAMQDAWDTPRQKATLLTKALFFSEGAEPIAAADLPEKLRRVFEQHGGFPMAYTLPKSGNPETRKIKECAQAVDTLNKMAARYSKGADLGYRMALSTLAYLTMFHRGGEDERRTS